MLKSCENRGDKGASSILNEFKTKVGQLYKPGIHILFNSINYILFKLKKTHYHYWC